MLCGYAGCGEAFQPRVKWQRFYCGTCKESNRNPPSEVIAKACVLCGKEYRSADQRSMYCGSKCKVNACRYRKGRTPQKVLDAARAGERAARAHRSQERKAMIAANLAAIIADRHRQCRTCGIAYCLLPMAGQGYEFPRLMACPDCKVLNAAEGRRIAKRRQNARKRGATVESVSPTEVFKRDRWRCYLCGESTPASLRGTTDLLAPELEHVVPLSRGGAHSYANCRCACRQCNHLKGDLTEDEFRSGLPKLRTRGYAKTLGVPSA